MWTNGIRIGENGKIWHDKAKCFYEKKQKRAVHTYNKNDWFSARWIKNNVIILPGYIIYSCVFLQPGIQYYYPALSDYQIKIGY